MQNTNNPFLRLVWDPTSTISLPVFAASLLLAALLAWLLGAVYVRFGTALSNRRLFARNFILLAVTTTLVISIVKSSLALSLGLVGALSIVRFRAAIKEPEELVFLFLAISIGLGLGAGQAAATGVALLIVFAFLAARQLRGPGPSGAGSNLFLTLHSTGRTLGASQINTLLKECGGAGTLRRLEDSAEAVEASFAVSFTDTTKLEEFTRKVRGLDAQARVSFVEDRGHGV